MNNKLFRSYLILFISLLLAGCGSEPECQHQWTEADCLNAGSCALCGEVQAEALGHDWVPASCESPESCSRCGETKGEALGHSYGQWLLDEKEMYRVCSGCEQSESTEIDYALYLQQHIYGRWNLCSMIKNGRYLDSYWLPQSELDPEYCFYEDGRVSSMGFEEKEISPSWSFDRGEYDSANYCHKIYISFPNNNALSSAWFNCIGDDVTYEIPLNDEGDVVTLSNSFGDAVGKALAGTWSAWSQGSIYSISFFEDRSFTADIDGEIRGFWQPRKPSDYDGSSGDVHIMVNYSKDGKDYSKFTTLSGFSSSLSQSQLANSMTFSMDVNDTYSHFALDAKKFLTETAKTADSAHLGNWTSIDYIVSTPNYESYSSDEERGLSTEYSIVFNEDGSFSAKLNREIEGQWSLRGIRQEYMGVCMEYNLTAPGINDYSYFQMYDNGDGYAYVSYADNVSANYSLKQMNEEEIAARNELAANAPNMVVGQWFAADNSGVEAAFNEDGTFSLNLGSNGQHEGLWHFNSMNEYDGTRYYYYDIETDYETYYAYVFGPDFDYSALLPEETEDGEASKYLEEYALCLIDRGGAFTLQFGSYFGEFDMIDAGGLAAAKEATSKLLGHWTADTAAEYDWETQQSTDVSVDFYLDIAEDGSFTGNLGEDVQGTWRFFEMQDGISRYLFTVVGAEMDSLYALEGEVLSGYYEPYIIDFTK